ncbi:MAG: hypothetical protein ACK6C4_00210 [Bacteroidota bacterium]
MKSLTPKTQNPTPKTYNLRVALRNPVVPTATKDRTMRFAQ